MKTSISDGNSQPGLGHSIALAIRFQTDLLRINLRQQRRLLARLVILLVRQLLLQVLLAVFPEHIRRNERLEQA